MKEQAAASCYETACSIHCFKNDHRQNDHRHTAAQILDAPGSLDRQYTKSTPASAPARCAMWPTWWPAITVPPAFIDIVSCNSCLMTNCPRMPHSISFLRLKLSLTSTLTANNPNTAPDAPREIVACGCNKYDATLAPTAVMMYVNHTPHIPSSSSTILPKTYSRKVLLDRWAHEPWQKLLVMNCHHLGAI